jgi:hypothetical protein
LNQFPVECLVIEGETSTKWIPWITNAREENRPEAILNFIDKELLDHDDGPMSKAQRKILTKLGYDVRYWYLQAWEFGAALDLSTVCMVWYKTDDPLSKMPIPRSSALPVRPMSNLLKPFGVPSKAWSRREPKPLHGTPSVGPCKLKGQINGELVFDELGAMPNDVGSWISTVKGTRRLQYGELAKAKGINELLVDCEDSKLRPTIRESMGIHVWAAALDALGTWMQGPADDDNQTASTVEDMEFPPWEDDAGETSDEEWTWEPPNLREHQPWYLDRVESF